MKSGKVVKKVAQTRGQRPPNHKYKKKVSVGLGKSRSKFARTIPDTSAIPWLGPLTTKA